MNSKNANLALLLGLTFLWFISGIIATFMFSFALGGYSDAGDETTPMMVFSLLLLVFFPMICVHTLIHGWRRFSQADYASIIRIVLLPFPILLLVVFAYLQAWP